MSTSGETKSESVGSNKQIQIEDPDGNPIELFEPASQNK